MYPFVQTVFVVGIAVIATGIVSAAFELRQIRNLLAAGKIRLEFCPERSRFRSRMGGGSPGGYALFVFRQGRWMLEEDLSQPGFEAVAPVIAGAFEGQVVKKESGLSRRR